MVIIGLGTGGIKANVTPFCAEQYKKVDAYVKSLKSGERVIVDPELTVERMFMWYDFPKYLNREDMCLCESCRFYWAVNVGALSPLITVNVEAKVSFWLAFLIPLMSVHLLVCPTVDRVLTECSVIILAAIIFIVSSRLFLKPKPEGSPIVDAARTIHVAIAEKGFGNAKPSILREHGRLDRYSITSSDKYTDQSVMKVKSGLTACKAGRPVYPGLFL